MSVTLAEAERKDLPLLSASRNRILRSPSPVQVRPAGIREAFATLESLARRLV